MKAQMIIIDRQHPGKACSGKWKTSPTACSASTASPARASQPSANRGRKPLKLGDWALRSSLVRKPLLGMLSQRLWRN